MLSQQRISLVCKTDKYLKNIPVYKYLYSVNGIKYKLCDYTDVIKYFLMKEVCLWPELIGASERSGDCESTEVGFSCLCGLGFLLWWFLFLMFQEIQSEFLPLSKYGEQLNVAKPNNGNCLKRKNKFFFLVSVYHHFQFGFCNPKCPPRVCM